MNTVYKRISSVLIVLFLLSVSAVGMGVPLSADAVQESGNIRLLLEPAFEGVGVSLVDIGIVDNGTFKVNDTFSPSGISFEGVETSKQLSAVAEKAVEYAKDNQLEGTVGRVDFDGEINFYEVGTEKVYLLYQYDGFDYVALGHIHSPQQVGRREVRYSGSPLKYSLSEVNNEKSVSLITVNGKGNVDIELVPIRPMRNLRHLKAFLLH